jgi:enamine deaminase RidA (YjgF/YER057c/UK114 family)
MAGWRFHLRDWDGSHRSVHRKSGRQYRNTIEQQAEQTIDNISAILEADGTSLHDVV